MRLREGQVLGAGWTLPPGEGRRREYCRYTLDQMPSPAVRFLVTVERIQVAGLAKDD
jgi:hypothetical protein